MKQLKSVHTKTFNITLFRSETGSYKIEYGPNYEESKELYLYDLSSALWAFDVQLNALVGH